MSGDKSASEDSAWSRLQPVLDNAVNALPERYRLPLVLHHLEGHSQEEVARVVGCSQATLTVQLTRARQALKARLDRSDVTLSIATLAVLLAERSLDVPLPESLVVSTSKAAALIAAGNSAAGEHVSAQAAEMAQGAMRGMFMKKMRWVAAAVLLLVFLGGSVGVAMRAAEEPAPVVASSNKDAAGKAPAQPPAPKPPQASAPAPAAPVAAAPAADDPFVAQVQKLGDKDETVRETAETSLRQAGKKAEAALQAGSSDKDPQVKNRCTALLGVLKTQPELDKIVAALKRSKSFECDVHIVTKLFGQDMDQTGHLISSGDAQWVTMDADVKAAGQNIKVRLRSDGKTLWNETTMGGKVSVQRVTREVLRQKAPLSEKNLDVLGAFKETVTMMDFTEISEGTLEDVPVYVLTGQMRSLGAEQKAEITKALGPSVLDTLKTMKRAVVQVDRKDSFLRKIEMFDEAGASISMSYFHNVKLDVPLKNEMFGYTAADGVTVIDVDKLLNAQNAVPEKPPAPEKSNF